MIEPLIRLNHAERCYPLGKQQFFYVLRDISLEVADGDFVSVMGPSGAGKSTLLHLVGMTELFARLAPGKNLDEAGAELRSVYATIKKDHPEAYSKSGDFQISAKLLRDQITSGARTVLLVLLAASALVFVVACWAITASIFVFCSGVRLRLANETAQAIFPCLFPTCFVQSPCSPANIVPVTKSPAATNAMSLVIMKT